MHISLSSGPSEQYPNRETSGEIWPQQNFHLQSIQYQPDSSRWENRHFEPQLWVLITNILIIFIAYTMPVMWNTIGVLR